MTTKISTTTTATNYYENEQLLLESDYITFFCNHSTIELKELLIYHRTGAMVLFKISLYVSQIHSLVKIKGRRTLINNEIPEFRSYFYCGYRPKFFAQKTISEKNFVVDSNQFFDTTISFSPLRPITCFWNECHHM